MRHAVANPNTSPAVPRLDTGTQPWVPLSTPGLSMKLIAVLPGDAGYHLLLRLEPGTVIPRHRHTGEVHAFNLSGHRLLLDTGERIGPGTYVHEPAGNVDSWQAVGDEPCVVHVVAHGRVEYLDELGRVIRHTDAGTARRTHLAWCAEHGVAPHPSLAGVSLAEALP